MMPAPHRMFAALLDELQWEIDTHSTPDFTPTAIVGTFDGPAGLRMRISIQILPPAHPQVDEP